MSKIIGNTVGTPMNPQKFADAGESAYDIAVKLGFEGTEAEWIASLNGKDGKDGVDGKDGYTPQKGVDYFDGKNGSDGVSPTVSVSKSGKITTVTITDKSGTKTATISDGVDGKDGSDGQDGADGKTPVKGVDYYTEADKAEMVSAVTAALPVYNGEAVIV